MKNIIPTIIFICLTLTLFAQDAAHKFSVGINMLRYAPASSKYYDQDDDNPTLTVINGFSLGYQHKNWLGYFTDFRSINSYIDNDCFDCIEKLDTKGIEISIGAMVSSKEYNRFSLNLSLEAFGEFTKVRGLQSFGDPTLYEVNHKKNYLGLAPGFIVNFRLTEQLFLYAKTRYRIGRVSYEGIEETLPFEAPLLWDRHFNCLMFDSFSGFGLRVTF